MGPERWEKVAEVYQAACTLEPARRSAFLAQACQGDEELRREVESLLEQDTSRDGVLERVAQDARRCNLPATRSVAQSLPWWIWVIATSFVLNFALMIYLDFAGPVLGMDVRFIRGAVVVTRI